MMNMKVSNGYNGGRGIEEDMSNNDYADYLNVGKTKLGLTKKIKKQFDETFKVDININHFCDVISGEGHEEDKIDSVYSSSLQSLVIFDRVSKNNPIYFKLGDEEYEFTKVYFEYKNKVIRAPSSIDVALTNEKGDVLFIESKLFEIIRDSVSKEDIEKNDNLCREIRASYFSNNENGYKEKLDFEKGDFKQLGIEDCPSWYGSKPEDDIVRKMIPINGNRYVYAYGIKQLLSHIIGILNYRNPDDNCSRQLKNKAKSIHFVTLINDLPNYPDVEPKEKIECFKNHYNTVVKFLKDNRKDKLRVGKKQVNLYDIMTYQNLYKMNKDYFSEIGKIVDIYHLNQDDKGNTTNE